MPLRIPTFVLAIVLLIGVTLVTTFAVTMAPPRKNVAVASITSAVPVCPNRGMIDIGA